MAGLEPQTQQTGQEPTLTPAQPGQQQTGQDPTQQAAQQGPGEQGQTQGQESWLDTLPPEAQAEIRKLRGESASRRTELQQERERREALERAQETETQRNQREATEAKADAANARRELAQIKVAGSKGLPLGLASRLQGDTEEQLAADADKLMAEFGVAQQGQQAAQPQQRTNFDQGVRPPASGQVDGGMSSLIRRAAGRPA